MKKLLFILSLMFALTVSSYGQDKSKLFSGSFKTGYYSGRTIIYLGQEMLDKGILPSYDLNAFYGKLQFNVDYKGVKFYTSNRTFFNKDKELNYVNPYFTPLQTEFITGLSYKWKMITVNYEHLCSHTFEAKNFSQAYDDFSVEVKF